MNERLGRGRHVRTIETVAQLAARLGSVLTNGFGNDRNTALSLLVAHAFLVQPAPISSLDLRRGERMQPPVVLGAHEVQRPAVEPGNHHAPGVGQGRIDIGGV